MTSNDTYTVRARDQKVSVFKIIFTSFRTQTRENSFFRLETMPSSLSVFFFSSSVTFIIKATTLLVVQTKQQNGFFRRKSFLRPLKFLPLLFNTVTYGKKSIFDCFPQWKVYEVKNFSKVKLFCVWNMWFLVLMWTNATKNLYCMFKTLWCTSIQSLSRSGFFCWISKKKTHPETMDGML